MAGNLFSRSLSSNTNSMNVLEMEKDQQSAAAHMSATALLQKAAQMGATMSNTNSCMAPPSFGHDQYDHISSYGMNVMGNVSNGVGNGMNSVDMFNAILDQSKALSRMIQQNSRSSNVSISSNCNDNNGGLLGGGSSNKGSEDVMTVDFLGIGGAAGGGPHDAFLWRPTA